MACPELPRLSGSGGAPRFAAERVPGGSTRGGLFLLGGVGGGPGGRVSQGRGDVVQLDTMGALPVAAEAVRVEADPLDPVELAAEAVGDRVYLVGLGRELAGEGAYRTDIHSGEAGHRRTFLRVSCVLLQVLQRYPRAGWRGMGTTPRAQPSPTQPTWTTDVLPRWTNNARPGGKSARPNRFGKGVRNIRSPSGGSGAKASPYRLAFTCASRPIPPVMVADSPSATRSSSSSRHSFTSSVSARSAGPLASSATFSKNTATGSAVVPAV